jgi:hypothetical protein
MVIEGVAIGMKRRKKRNKVLEVIIKNEIN